MRKAIETKRLVFRPIIASDLQGMFELDSDPEVHRYLGKKPIQTVEDAKSVIKYIHSQYEKDGIGRWAVIDKSTNEFVGWAGIKYEREVRDEMDYYDLGYRLKKKFWGRGIATEAAKVFLDFGFSEMQLNIMYAGAHIDNIASNKVLQKTGFKYLETFEYDGESHHWYSIDKADWQELKMNEFPLEIT